MRSRTWMAGLVLAALLPIAAPAQTAARTDSAGAASRPARAVEQMPRLLNLPGVQRAMEEHFPAHLRGLEITALVELRFRVLENGRVDVETVQLVATNDPRFVEAARTVVEGLRFRPGRMNGRRVKLWVSLPLQFRSVPEYPVTPETGNRG